jgi:micrococcal nuclease
MNDIEERLYHYRAKVGRVIDGDTFTLEYIDLGFGVYKYPNQDEEIKVRMLGIDTKELRSKDVFEKQLAYQAKDYMTNRLTGKEVIIHSTSVDVFGRILAIVYLDGECLNDTLLSNGLADVYTRD